MPSTVRDVAPHIGGRSLEVGGWAEYLDPYRGDVVSRVARSDAGIVELAVDAARAVQPVIAGMSVAERAAVLRRVADLVEARSEQLAITISREIGKALKNTRREVRRSAWTFRAAAAAAENLHATVGLASAAPEGAGLVVLGSRIPVGIVGAITPFNAPFNLVAHKVAPAFAAGNATIVKPASQAAASALDLALLLEEAGAPAGAVSVVPGDRTTVEAMARHPGFNLYTLTGGRGAAAALVALAGPRRSLLELGGNSPNIVHSDADLAVAVRECTSGGFSNTGQSCNSVQRIYVHESVADEFIERLMASTSGLGLGDPLDPATDVGTLVNEEAAKRVIGWIDEARGRGARILSGGSRIGAAISPTIVADVADDARLVCEEVFGPVVVVLPYRTLGEAIARANASAYGLQAAIFTSSLGVAFEAAVSLEAGGVLVNRSTNFRLDHLPYGGVKDSGVGREGPAYAVEEMTTLKLVLIDPLRPPS